MPSDLYDELLIGIARNFFESIGVILEQWHNGADFNDIHLACFEVLGVDELVLFPIRHTVVELAS